MRKIATAPLLLLVFAAGCALAVLWTWHQDPTSAPTVQHPLSLAERPTRPAPAPAATAAGLNVNPELKKLLAAVAQLLLRKDVRANEAIVSFKDDAALARFLARAEKAGLAVLGKVDALRTVRVHFDAAAALQADLAQNAGDYGDLSGNYVFTAPPAPTKEQRAAINQVPFGNDTLDFIGASGDRTQWGRGVTIAVLDTGIAPDPTFGRGRLTALDIGLGTAPGKAVDDGHGTSVASLAGGMSPDAGGVAPAANLLSIRVTDTNGASDIFTIAQGIVTAVDAGAQIVNVSMGGYGTNTALTNAITYALDHGAVVVAAAGNDQAAQLNWPAADPRVVSVGAVDKAEQQVTFSNSGPQLQLTAPGLGVQTAWLDGQRAYVDGTSASAPLVAGAIAAVISRNPTLTPVQAAQLLTQTANDAGAPGNDPSYGHGILNLAWAMNANNPAYVDTAVASHYFDAATNQMEFVIQNRSGQAMAGLALNLSTNGTPSTVAIGDLTPGQSTVVKIPVDPAQYDIGGKIRYTTTLVNPFGVSDQVPANNRRTSVLTRAK